MPRIENRGERGLSGHFHEGSAPRRRVGLAPRSGHIDREAPYRRIAAQEAWTFPALVKAQREYLDSGDAPGDALKLAGMHAGMPGLQKMLQDLDDTRLQHMEEYNIERQVLMLAAPGVQVVRPGDGTALAREANDIVAEACRNHPRRFSACAAFDPRDVAGSVRELERASGELGLRGAVVGSNFEGHYLDEQAYLPILEALEALGLPLCIQPTMPFEAVHHQRRGLAGALAGFQHDVWLHVMGLIMSGALDRFPGLKLVIGHLGEAMPLHLYRFDWMQGAVEGEPRTAIMDGAEMPEQPVSHYFQRNIWLTTNGMGWEPAIRFCMDVLGPDRVLYAMGYPYLQSPDEVAAYDRLRIPAQDKKLLMEDNARQLFRLG